MRAKKPRSIICACAVGLTMAGPVVADVDAHIDAAIAEVSAAAPQFYYASQSMIQLQGCSVAVRAARAAPEEARAQSYQITAALGELDYSNAQIADVPTGVGEGRVILIPSADNRYFPILWQTEGADDAFQDTIVAQGGTCNADACTLPATDRYFRVQVMTTGPQSTAETILATLAEAGAACGAAGS